MANSPTIIQNRMQTELTNLGNNAAANSVAVSAFTGSVHGSGEETTGKAATMTGQVTLALAVVVGATRGFKSGQ